jgi:hypothetical protein
MLISNAEKLCRRRGFHGCAELVRHGRYDFVITTAAGRYRLPITRRASHDTGQVSGYVVEAILIHDRPLAATPARAIETGRLS